MPQRPTKHHEEQIKQFLKKLKTAISQKHLILIGRKENLETLSKLGLTLKNALDIIYTLTITDHISGPEPDNKGRPGDIWKFIKRLEAKNIYIKLCDLKDNTGKIICVSFHETKYEKGEGI
jgi:hypothetical protein